MAEDVFGIVGTTQAGTFQVESVVAEGGFGVVYRAYHGAFRAPVALKCLKIPQSLTQKGQADFLERFREEAELMFRLSAGIPAVVRPLHVDVITTSSGQFVPYMVLEWLDGETLVIEGDTAVEGPEGMRGLWAEVHVPRYRRSFTLSRELDTSRIEAGIKDGVLTLRIPKQPHVQPRRIAVSLG